VVGGANSAGQAAVYFSQYAGQVTMLARSPLEKSMSRYLIEQLAARPNVDVRTGAVPVAAEGEDGRLRALHIRDAAGAEAVAAGEVLLEPAEPARGLLLLLEGTARTLLLAEGREERLGRQEAPTWIGAIAALTGGTLGVRMQAESACRLARIPAPRFTELAL